MSSHRREVLTADRGGLESLGQKKESDRESVHFPLRSSEVRKSCLKCGAVKLLCDFATDRSKASGHKSWCKPCDAEKSARYYRANAEAVIARVSNRAARRKVNG